MTRAVPAVVRALDVLELFLKQSQPLSVPEMTARLHLPRSTTHELIQTLVSKGYLVPMSDQPHRFALGVRVLELGTAYSRGFDLAREGREVARSLVADCHETVQLGILEGTEVLYVAKEDSPHQVRLVSAIGRRLPAHCTGLGKMLLSGLTEEELAARYQGAGRLEAMTSNSITSLEVLMRELAEVRARGLAYDNCESNLDVCCVAAPVYDHEGHLVASMSISVPSSRMSPERLPSLASLVRRGAAELSRRLGHTAWIRTC